MVYIEILVKQQYTHSLGARNSVNMRIPQNSREVEWERICRSSPTAQDSIKYAVKTFLSSQDHLLQTEYTHGHGKKVISQF